MFVRTNDGRAFYVFQAEDCPQGFTAYPAYKPGSLWVQRRSQPPRLLRKAGCVKIAESDGIPLKTPIAI